ncbi:hypothetical protein EGW08_014576 [Elysia chlorotica]|uniref:C-type lectin domain-containing protein n=1 Tax=Elysia chlorotica TaxID=188477 RepID=A0A433T7W3_ELYCH|nr:hypothetical protein EGW08_014576 [Elysia chlorotica]
MNSVQLAAEVAVILLSIFFNISEGCYYKDCKEQYVKVEHVGTCIKLSSNNASWTQARQLCQQENADLVKIVDGRMDQFISYLMNVGPNLYGYWIGCNDIKKEGVFAWLDEDVKIGYSNWQEGEPDQLTTEHCTEKRTQRFNGTWNDLTCTKKRHFICEYTPDCEDGYYGPNCTKKCSRNCAGENNPCSGPGGICQHGCVPGYLGGSCRQRCSIGYYGDGCSKKCSKNCIMCNNVDGKCYYCRFGYYGPQCSKTLEYDSWTLDGPLVAVVLVACVISVSAAFAIGSLVIRARLSGR